ncbi:MAG: thrombospondin type 3 repeat-containing protein [Candidatus Diapherotrites archaeon]|nr:thrombospondin type 3 repeat-containing protein [Candidatus Diapherotrites archaeon]
MNYKLISLLFFLIFILNVFSAGLCSLPEPISSDLGLTLTAWSVQGNAVLKEGDTVNISFTLHNYNREPKQLGSKGAFITAINPLEAREEFGFSNVNELISGGTSITINSSKTLNKAGRWILWPAYSIAFPSAELISPDYWIECELMVEEATAPDADGDGVPDSTDNCINISNAGQEDSDSDGVGNVCDNCINVLNPEQSDSDADGIGDACEPVVIDSDSDGFPDSQDNCPNVANSNQSDIDSDGLGDLCDSCDDRDSDDDGIKNCLDECINEKESVNNFEDLDGCPDVKPLPAISSVVSVKMNFMGMEKVVSVMDWFTLDDDDDGILNFVDECPETPEDVPVFENGCRCNDSDGINKNIKGMIQFMQKAPNVNINGETQSLGSVTNMFKEDYCDGNSVVELYCSYKYEKGLIDSPYNSLKSSCTIGCNAGKCIAFNSCSSSSGTCADGIKNQNETGIDCGGKCSPCNSKCNTNVKFAPSDTPCTNVYPNDMHKVDFTWTDSDLEYICRYYEICHPDLDFIIEEAQECCSISTEDELQSFSHSSVCKTALKESQGNCKKCVGLYILKGLGRGALWMKGYNEIADINPSLSPPPTAENLINYYETGVCRDYSLAALTLLRKAGYKQEELAGFCDGAHCYSLIKFPGDSKFTVVDTTGNFNDFTLGGLPSTGYNYCGNLNEDKWCFAINPGQYHEYFTGTIYDLDEYWQIVNSGKSYPYPKDYDCDSSYGKFFRDFLPQCGPGAACGRDNFKIPDFAPKLNQIQGCN